MSFDVFVIFSCLQYVSRVGELRYRLPQSIPPYTRTYDATNYGPNCVQPATSTPNITAIAGPTAQNVLNGIIGSLTQAESEDCKHSFWPS